MDDGAAQNARDQAHTASPQRWRLLPHATEHAPFLARWTCTNGRFNQARSTSTWLLDDRHQIGRSAVMSPTGMQPASARDRGREERRCFRSANVRCCFADVRNEKGGLI